MTRKTSPYAGPLEFKSVEGFVETRSGVKVWVYDYEGRIELTVDGSLGLDELREVLTLLNAEFGG